MHIQVRPRLRLRGNFGSYAD